MKASSPSPEIARFIARILAHRTTPIGEIPQVVEAVQRGLELAQAPEEAAVPAATDGFDRVDALDTTSAVEIAAPDADALVPLTAKRRRGRPRKEILPFAPAAEPARAAPVLAPRLMRRAEVAASEGGWRSAADPAPAPVDRAVRAPKAALRGVVKWFDSRTKSGALRLPGYGDDVAVDADALDRAGIPRLFKGQEIEASIAEDEQGRARLITLSLPGRPETETLLPHSSARGSARRHAKPVVIELKRDALRRIAARVEAEQILGRPAGRRARHPVEPS
jgi:cold shock CspA family protein